MLFNSYEFILIFFPLSILSLILFDYLKIKKIFSLLIFSFIFYYYDNSNSFLLLIINAIINYFFSILISSILNKKIKFILLIFIIAIDLLILSYYKYFLYFINILKKFSFEVTNPSLEIYLPLAISFYTFHQISYQIDNYKKNIKKKNIIDYFLYLSFFPHLIAGPILRYKNFIFEILKKNFLKINYQNFSIGISIIFLGLFKKIFLADNVAMIVNKLNIEIANGIIVSGFDYLFYILSFSIQIYLDFSAYSDIATGIGVILNYNMPINFNSPYKAISIIDFWKRWHITLSQFFRDYLYLPMNGNKNILFIKILIIIFIMSIVGLWHGASHNFILWGILHGILISFNHSFNYFREKFKIKFTFNDFLSRIFVFFLVSYIFIFFRETDIFNSIKIIKESLNFFSYFSYSYFLHNINLFNKVILFFSLCIIFFFPNIFQIFKLKLINISSIEYTKINFKLNYIWLFLIIFLLIYVLLNLNNPTEFIYFRF